MTEQKLNRPALSNLANVSAEGRESSKIGNIAAHSPAQNASNKYHNMNSKMEI